MNKALQVAKLLLLCSATACLLALTSLLLEARVQARNLAASTAVTMQHLQTDTDSITQSVTATTTDARRLILIAGGTLNIARDTLRDQQSTIKAESAQILHTTENVDALTAEATKTLQDMDSNSGKSLDQLTETLKSIPPLMQQTTETMTQSQVTIVKAGETIDSLNAVVKGPVMGTLTNVQNTTKTVDQYVTKLMTPRGFVSELWHGLLSLVTPGATVYTAVK